MRRGDTSHFVVGQVCSSFRNGRRVYTSSWQSWQRRDLNIHRTIKSYLPGVRHMHIMEGLGDPFKQPLEQLHYVLRGVKRCEGVRGMDTRERLPISLEILRKIKAELERVQPVSHDRVLLWAACSLAFFGFLRARELTVSGDDAFDPASHLTREDLAVNIPEDPTVVRVRLKASKTDPFKRGVTLLIGKGAPDLCPVKALVCYLLVRGEKAGPLFVFEDGRFLTRQRFVKEVREALGEAGVDCTSTVATASGSGQLRQQHPGGWKTPLS